MMKKTFLIFMLITVFGFSAGAQVNVSTTFVMVGDYGTFSGSDSLFTGPVTFLSDQLGESYFPTAIDSGFIAIDGFRNYYRVDSVLAADGSSATLRLVDLASPYAAPSGRGQVYEPFSDSPYLIPPPPENNSGTPPNYNSVIHISNLARVISDFTTFSGLDTVARDATLTGNGTAGSPLSVASGIWQDSVNTIFNDSDFSEASTHFLFEDALGSWSTRFRSPSTNAYFTLSSDTTDTDFLGLTWNTLGGNAKIGHRTGGYYLEYGDDLIINSTNALDRMFITYSMDTDNTNTQAIAKDPSTGELELVDLASTVHLDNIGLGDTLVQGVTLDTFRIKSLLPGTNITLTDADSTITIANTIGPIATSDQPLSANRYLNGSQNYYLYLDSLTSFFLNADEYFLTDDSTGLSSFAGTSLRQQKRNAGLLRINSLGLDYVVLQNTDGSSLRNTVQLEEDRFQAYALEKESDSVAEFGSKLDMSSSQAILSSLDSLDQGGSIEITHSGLTIDGTDTIAIKTTGLTQDESIAMVLAVDTIGGGNRLYLKSSTFGSTSRDVLTSGVLTAEVARISGSATSIANPAPGEYVITVPPGADAQRIDIESDNTTLNASNELIIQIDNSANSYDRYYTAQILSLIDDGQVNQFATGTNYTQTVSGNITTITFPNMNGFGGFGSGFGYRIMLR